MENSSGDLSVIVIFPDIDSANVGSGARKRRESILGESWRSIVVVIVKVSLGGKWIWKVSRRSTGVVFVDVVAVAGIFGQK